jgi:hypothetical protein
MIKLLKPGYDPSAIRHHAVHRLASADNLIHQAGYHPTHHLTMDDIAMQQCCLRQLQERLYPFPLFNLNVVHVGQ